MSKTVTTAVVTFAIALTVVLVWFFAFRSSPNFEPSWADLPSPEAIEAAFKVAPVARGPKAAGWDLPAVAFSGAAESFASKTLTVVAADGPNPLLLASGIASKPISGTTTFALETEGHTGLMVVWSSGDGWVLVAVWGPAPVLAQDAPILEGLAEAGRKADG
jgi:hypothetical protein